MNDSLSTLPEIVVGDGVFLAKDHHHHQSFVEDLIRPHPLFLLPTP